MKIQKFSPTKIRTIRYVYMNMFLRLRVMCLIFNNYFLQRDYSIQLLCNHCASYRITWILSLVVAQFMACGLMDSSNTAIMCNLIDAKQLRYKSTQENLVNIYMP